MCKTSMIAPTRSRPLGFALPVKSAEVPTSEAWFDEVKYDGYRMMVIRENERVRLISRGGHDYAKRYPWIVEAARANRHKHFAIDGEVVLLGVDGISDFDGLHSGKHNDEAQFYTFDILALNGDDFASPALVDAQVPP
jgi:ATP-dependent DNA ligase